MNCMPYGDEAHSERKPGDQPLLKFWPYGLEQPDARWEELVEMLRCFCKDLMLVGTEGLIPFDAREVEVISPRPPLREPGKSAIARITCDSSQGGCDWILRQPS
jgi:hypothetical protein